MGVRGERSVPIGIHRRRLLRRRLKRPLGKRRQFRKTLIHQRFDQLTGNPFEERAGPMRQPGAIVEQGEIKTLPQGAEQVARKRFRLGYPSPKGLRPLLRNEGIRILAIGQKQHPHRYPIIQRIERQLSCFPGGPAPRSVAVETQHHLRREAEELFQMISGGCRTEGRAGFRHPRLGKAHHIHIALHQEDPLRISQGLATLPEAVELPPLMKHGSFRGIQILRLTVAKHPSPKANGAPPPIANGEGDAVSEAIVASTAFPTGQEPGFNELLLEGLPTPKGLQEIFVTRRRVANTKVLRRGTGESATLQIFHGPGALRVLAKLKLEPPIGPLEHRKERASPIIFPHHPRFPGHLHPRHGCQGLHGLHEFQAVVLKKKGEGRAMHAAAEAMVEALFRDHMKGGGLLPVKGA